MITTDQPLPVTGLADLSVETRIIGTPWSRMVRGIGLGQHPIGYRAAVDTQLRSTIEHLARKVSNANPYSHFAGQLTSFILDAVAPGAPAKTTRIEDVVTAIRAEPNPYYRLMAGCITMEVLAKLGLGTKLICNRDLDLPSETLAALDEIQPNRIADENQGRHGDYERLSASTAVLLAFGNLGIHGRLVTGPRNYIDESLALLERVPAPFFRGRGGSMLLSVISLLGYQHYALDNGRDYLRETLDWMDRADELNLPPSFPNPMTPAFAKIYPLVTMLNAIALTGRRKYLRHGKDRLREVSTLFGQISPVERTHMGLYYLVALHNLGLLHEELSSVNAFVESIVGQWPRIDPGDGFFLNGIAYPYMIQTALFTGRMDLITDATTARLVNSFPDLDRTVFDRTNRPYPASYILTALGEIGAADQLFMPSDRYHGVAPMTWVIDNLSPEAREEGARLNMLGHALINYALRLRAPSAQPQIFTRFNFPRLS